MSKQTLNELVSTAIAEEGTGIRIHTMAPSRESAITSVLNAELAPRRAILRVTKSRKAMRI